MESSKEDEAVSHKASVPSRKAQCRIAVQELRENYKRQLSLPKKKDVLSVYDPIEKAHNSVSVVRGKTGIIFNEDSNKHFCLWEPKHVEDPERMMCILRRCKELDLFSECEQFEPTAATQEYIETLHTKNLFEIVKETQHIIDSDALEDVASRHSDVYVNQGTFESALIAAGSTLEIVKAVVQERVHNGMAIVRPPGHHAMNDALCGYCIFNNVALAAQFVLDELHIRRILIVDWDVHHGQGTQRFFYEDPRVLYFSTHRYDHGEFWPNLRESEFDYIGEGEGKGFNFNIPLNEAGLKNEDFLAYFHQILLPVAYEYKPQLVLVSAGYDTAIGCPEGRLSLTPAFFAHMTSELMALAYGKVVVVLEGGYCPESLSEAAALTLRALMGKPCPSLRDPLGPPSQSMQASILNSIFVHKLYWKSLQFQENVTSVHLPLHVPKIICKHPPPIVGKYDTRVPPSIIPDDEKKILLQEIESLKEGTSLHTCPHRVCLVYDKDMEKHVNVVEKNFPERPARTQEIMKRLEEFGLLSRVHNLKSRKATAEELELVHHPDLTRIIVGSSSLTPKELYRLQSDYDSIYFNESTADAAVIAAGCLLQVVDSVCEGTSQSGIAVIRPPGHHAELKEPYGFCFFNNVGIAAAYVLKRYSIKRILIVDWDIHHGNGIQHMFESNPDVLYISIHLYKNGNFFPFSCEANTNYVGTGSGRGFNINIPWSKSGMGDAEYMAAFTQIVLPVAYEYNPELVIVSAGFDAAINDPLGGCCVTPECYGHMTHLLTTLAGGRVILALEGGYNLASISYSMAMCCKALLGDPIPPLKAGLAPCESGVETIKEVIGTHKEYWHGLAFRVAFPDPSRFMLKSSVANSAHLTGNEDTHPQITVSLKDDSQGESDTEFLTPPQTPERQPLAHSQTVEGPPTQPPSTSDEALDLLVENLATISLSDESAQWNQTSSLKSVPSSVPRAAAELVSSCQSHLTWASLHTSLTATTSETQETFSAYFLSKKQTEGEKFNKELGQVDTHNLTNQNIKVKQSMDDKTATSQQSGTANPSEEASANDSLMDVELEGAVGGSEHSGMTIGQLLMGQQEMYAVVPLSDCPHLKEVMPVPSRGLDTYAPCEECLDPSENWVCLTCYKILCGRYVAEHMILHGEAFHHHLVLSFADLSAWCYACESYIDNDILREAKQAAHKSKFGENLLG